VRAGTGRVGESHVNTSGVSKPSHHEETGSGKPRGSDRGEAYSGMENMMSSWQAIDGWRHVGPQVPGQAYIFTKMSRPSFLSDFWAI